MTAIALPGVAWRYVDTAPHSGNWSHCNHCGDVPPCKCRYCDCCSEAWTSEASAPEHDDEYGRPRQDCPDCVTWKAEQKEMGT